MAADTLEPRFTELIAREAGVRPQQVEAASLLFADGATVPFVARYRKEATGGLDDAAVETIAKRRQYFLELQQRRDAILASIEEQGKLSDGLEKTIRAATTKSDLEDLYLPYKPKRRTRAQIARERGLEPLADALVEAAEAGSATATDVLADPFTAHDEVDDAQAALAGARDILAERLAESAEHRAALRRGLQGEGTLKVRALHGKADDPAAAVYRDYFEHDEPVAGVPSHRLLAILRGEREGFLLSDLAVDDDGWVERLGRSWGVGGGVGLTSPAGRELAAATADGYKRLLRPSITNEVRGELRARAEAEAIAVFRENLEALLLQSPLGLRPVMGLDPGYRTGCKVAVVDGTGRVLATDVIYPVQSSASRAEQATKILLDLVHRHDIHAIAVGNGTGSRETELFARRAAKDAGLESLIVAIVPETGASVYSASAVAREELPELDVALRGAVSIARRLQDPLAELVKIDPKSLGVGQYQHDVDQKRLAEELDLAVEGAVNAVGVELNSASPSLLRRVSGLTERLARNIVAHRDARGTFSTRRQLLDVSGFGPKTYEQAAGFLRVRDGEHPLDRTAVHPERYDLVEAMARSVGVGVADQQLVASVSLDRFVDTAAGVGRFTLADIRAELERPGRDPRPAYRAPAWRDDVTSIDDLEPGMQLEGRVSNVTNFGAFVDLGVKRDGMVHLSQLSDEWVDDPRKVVRVGQIVTVRVVEVDRERQRIGLSMKRDDGSGGRQTGGKAAVKRSSSKGPAKAAPKGPASRTSLEDLAARFKRR